MTYGWQQKGKTEACFIFRSWSRPKQTDLVPPSSLMQVHSSGPAGLETAEAGCYHAGHDRDGRRASDRGVMRPSGMQRFSLPAMTAHSELKQCSQKYPEKTLPDNRS